MDKKKERPEFMYIYKCTACGYDSGNLDEHAPEACKYCDEKGTMQLAEKKRITPELMADRLKELSERMFKNLQLAFESLSEEDKAAFPKDIDPEKQMLLLLAKAKELKEKMDGL